MPSQAKPKSTAKQGSKRARSAAAANADDDNELSPSTPSTMATASNSPSRCSPRKHAQPNQSPLLDAQSEEEDEEQQDWRHVHAGLGRTDPDPTGASHESDGDQDEESSSDEEDDSGTAGDDTAEPMVVTTARVDGSSGSGGGGEADLPLWERERPCNTSAAHWHFLDNKLVFFDIDVEVAGPKAGICQISAVVTSQEEILLGEFNAYVNPGPGAVWNMHSDATCHGLSPTDPRITGALPMQKAWLEFTCVYMKFR